MKPVMVVGEEDVSPEEASVPPRANADGAKTLRALRPGVRDERGGPPVTEKRSYWHHGLTTWRYTRAVSGKDVLSRRYRLGRVVARWRAEFVADHVRA